MTFIAFAAWLYAIAAIGVIGFQIALISGAPWGHITQGGQHVGALPTSGRIVAGVSILIIVCKASAILSAGGFWPLWPAWTSWIALTVQAIVTILNWITPSKAERRLWAPITTTMLALAAIAVLTS